MPRAERRAAAVGLLLVLLATAMIYARVATFGFVDLDDPVYLVDNDHVRRGLTLDGVRWAFTTARASNWHPLSWLAHMLDVELFGMAAGAHHLASLAWHLLNVVLLFALLRTATDETMASLFVAALFALHPVNVESVVWISERKNLISTTFALLSLAAWVRYARHGGRGAYAAAFVTLALGLLSKPMLVTIPFVFLLLDFWPLGRLKRGERRLAALVIEKLPLFALVAASGVVTFLVQRAGGAVGGIEALPFGARVGNAVLAYAGYLRKAVWPTDLAILYQHPYAPGGSVPSLGSLILMAVVLAALSACVVAFRRRGWPVTGSLWFVGTLVPVLGIVQVGEQGMADRYAYLPFVGLFIMFAFGASEWTKRHPSSRAAIAGLALLSLAALAGVTWNQTARWRDSVALFERGLEISPASPVLHYNLATSLEQRGEFEQAAGHYRRSIEVRPYHAPAHFGLANALAGEGHSEAAVQEYELALDLAPGRLDALFNLANTLQALGRPELAVERYRQALELEPTYFEARHNLGTTLLVLGRADEAAAELARAIEQRPGSADAHQNLALALLRAGRPREALDAFARAARLRPEWAAPLSGRAWILAASADPTLRDPAEAIRLAERALELSGLREPALLDTLAVAYAAGGEYDRAERTALEAVRLARAAGDGGRAAAIETRLALYRQRRPWVVPSRAEEGGS